MSAPLDAVRTRAWRARDRRLLRDARPEAGRRPPAHAATTMTPGAPLVAVISDGYWERQFARSAGGDRAARCDQRGARDDRRRQPARLRRRERRVDRRHHDGGRRAAAQSARAAAPLLGPGNFWLRVLARPQRRACRVARATARLNARLAADRGRGDCAALAGRRGAGHGGRGVPAEPGRNRLDLPARDLRKPLLVLMAVVGWCCSSRARTSRACCWRARRRGSERSPCVWRIGAGRGSESCVSC